MNPKGKKFLSLFLVFSLMMLSINLYAKERRGAEIIITKKNGVKIEGELITVKTYSLLILTKWSGRDESIDIADVEVITIVKKSKAGLGMGIGILVGAGGGALAGGTLGVEDADSLILPFGLIGAFGGLFVGGILGALAGKDKTIQIKGMTDLEINMTLNKLRAKARIRVY